MNTNWTQFWKDKKRFKQTALISSAVLLVVATVFTIVGFRSGSDTQRISEAATGIVRRGPLTISLTESGTIRPREQVILKNELRDPAAIVFIVEEGRLVRKGDLLVELDVTRAENEVTERRLRVLNDEADLTHAQENLKVVENQAQADIQQAELNHKFAVQDLDKYINGEYPKLLKEAEARITLAEEELSQAEEELKWSRILYDEKYLSQTELKQDELAAKKAQLNLDLARSAMELLTKYTYHRQIDQLNSDVAQAELALERTRRRAAANIAQAKAHLTAREAELNEETQWLARWEGEVKKGKIVAPIDGMVLYASSVRDRWRRDSEPFRTGTIIDRRDDIIYLPTASDFDVTIKIPEVALNKMEPGLPVSISVDALTDATVVGQVKSIAQLPDAESRYLNPNLKLYETVIEITSSDVPLRNGMSCRADIIIEEYDDVLSVPLQCVTRANGQPIVYVVEDEETIVPRTVDIGLDNARFVHIKSGLSEGERVLLTPSLSRSDADADSKQRQPPHESPPLPENSTQPPSHDT